MGKTSQAGLHEDLLLHQFTYLYTTSIAPRIENLFSFFSNRFKIETKPCIQTEYPSIYSETVICPLSANTPTTLKVTIYPNPKEEAIEIKTFDSSEGNFKEQKEKIKLSDWGTTEFDSIFLGKLYKSFFRKNY